jgi:hypothetical protein
MLLTPRESELFNVAVNLAASLDAANPDVGMGPSRQMLAQDVAAMLSFPVDEEDIQHIC